MIFTFVLVGNIVDLRLFHLDHCFDGENKTMFCVYNQDVTTSLLKDSDSCHL